MSRKRSFCDGISRRDVLRVGVAGTLGASFSLAEILHRQAQTAGPSRPSPDVPLIILFFQGGLSAIDTFDLKANGLAEFRDEFSPIDTNVTGMKICEHLPLLASHGEKFSLLQNFTHNKFGARRGRPLHAHRVSSHGRFQRQSEAEKSTTLLRLGDRPETGSEGLHSTLRLPAENVSLLRRGCWGPSVATRRPLRSGPTAPRKRSVSFSRKCST